MVEPDVASCSNDNINLQTCRKSFWKRALGRTFQAMVSVMAVKIQLSSPSMVRRSCSCPGTRSRRSRLTLGTTREPFCSTNQRNAICTGVVRHDVKRSAGRSGLIGSTWQRVPQRRGEEGVCVPIKNPYCYLGLICNGIHSTVNSLQCKPCRTPRNCQFYLQPSLPGFD